MPKNAVCHNLTNFYGIDNALYILIYMLNIIYNITPYRHSQTKLR